MPQLDGLRAVAMMCVMFHHWFPASWRFHFPTEAGLFLFFVLSGFLMTQGLLREQERETIGPILKRFHLKRLLRIYPAYYCALALAMALMVKDVLHAPQWWLLNLQNFYILKIGYWPTGVSHFWTLAVEQQYYLVWPLVILCTPKRALLFVLLLLLVVSPLSRLSNAGMEIFSGDLRPWELMDDFVMGSIVALLMHRRSQMLHTLRWCALLALIAYIYLYARLEMGRAVDYFWMMQQSFLAIALAGLISLAAVGKTGFVGRFLENRQLVRLGQMSYGIYLFHNLAPLLVGKCCWFLWDERLPATLGIWLRIPFYLLFTWLLSTLCHRFVEKRFHAIKVR